MEQTILPHDFFLNFIIHAGKILEGDYDGIAIHCQFLVHCCHGVQGSVLFYSNIYITIN